MATHTNLSSLFTDIADSIRSVSGGTASIQADTFPTAIQSLGSGFAKIQTGSYVGTGTYGASNPCSLTFDFILSLFIPDGLNYEQRFISKDKTVFYTTSTINSQTKNDINFNLRTISWFNTTNANYQLNHSGTIYWYIAIS